MDAKDQIQAEVRARLQSEGLTILEQDFARPWGGFFRIADESLQPFLQRYFQGVPVSADDSRKLSPKILIVAPGKRLSWQAHQRRSEVWKIVAGPVAVASSATDLQPAAPDIFSEGDLVWLPRETRHRLIGLEGWGIVAEIWQHTQPDHPSDEEDIIRIQDDFGR